mgnify:FL=1
MTLDTIGDIANPSLTEQSATEVPEEQPGLEAWYGAKEFSLTDGDPISTWADQSGNGNDATQGTSGDQPTYKENFNGSQPCVEFSAISDTDHLILPQGFMPSSPSGATLYVVLTCEYTSAPSGNGHAVYYNGDGSGTQADSHLPWKDGTVYEGWGRTTRNLTYSASGASIDTPHVYTITSGSTYEAYHNNTSTATDSSGSVAFDSNITEPKLGMHDGDATQDKRDWGGQVAEVIFYSAEHNSTDRTEVYDYLKSKWSL